MTPLHLAVKSAEDGFTTRSIRALLLKGADPSIKDNNGKIPADQLNDFNLDQPFAKEFVSEILELLEDESSNSCLSWFTDCDSFSIKQKFKKDGKSAKTLVFYLFIMVLTFSLFHFTI